MNITLKLEDTNWRNFLGRAVAVMKDKESLLKKAFLVIWPREAASHFEQEQGPEGAWAPWKNSTRQSRTIHEIRSAIGKQHAPGRLTAGEMAQGTRKTAGIRGKLYAAGKVVQKGGKLLQKTGKLRQQTVNEPILTSFFGGLKVESPTPYSGFLDEGTQFMEARPFMWLGDDAQDLLSKTFADFLGEAAGGMD